MKVKRIRGTLGKCTPENLAAQLQNLPVSPGVYLFRDSSGSVIYIGKARNLKNRVRSYFQDSNCKDPKTRIIRQRTSELDFILTDNEVEALILESNLVKKELPRLNVRLKDDKSFLHIKVTVQEEYPRVLLTRRIRKDGALYFGPYLPASLAKKTLRIINRYFQLRTCSIPIDGKLERPCLEYHIKRCLGPCVDGLSSPENYRQSLQEALMLLEGKTGQLIDRLTGRMAELAEAENFEAAALYRNRIKVLKELGEKQKITSAALFEADIFAYFHDGPRAALQVFSMRGGQILGKKEYFWEDLEFFSPRSFLRDALQQYYLDSTYVPQRILLPVEIEDQDVLKEWLRDKRKSSGRSGIEITIPKRGSNLDLVALVERNARMAFDSRFRILPDSRLKNPVMEQLRKELGLLKAPGLIEAFDISTIQGSETVASMVSCRNGLMQKKEYKKFIIRNKRIQGPDDFAAMQEVVYRRYKKLSDSGAGFPDLILLDGGKGQLHAAYQALSRLELDELPLAAIAKKEEIIFIQGQEEPVVLDQRSSALHLIQEIRDEAHRFAVTFHRKRRRKRDFTSELDNIPGIGPKRKQRLLQNLGSISRIRRASVEELTPYLGEKLAVELKKHLEEKK